MASPGSDSDLGTPSHLPELRMVLLGKRGDGVSSAGNTILGRDAFLSGRETVHCERREGVVSGRQVIVVETPGMEAYHANSISEGVKREIVNSVSLCTPGPYVFILVFGIGTFKLIERKLIKEQLKQLGDAVWRHTIVLFTRGDRQGNTTIEKHLKKEGKSLQKILSKCGNRYHVFNNKDRSDDTQVTELLIKIEDLMAKNKGQYFTISLDFNELQQRCKDLEREIVELRQKLEETKADEDKQREMHQTEIEQQRQAFEREIEQQREMYEEKLQQLRKDTEERDKEMKKLGQASGKSQEKELTSMLQTFPARKARSLPFKLPEMREEDPGTSTARYRIQEPPSKYSEVQPLALRKPSTDEEEVEEEEGKRVDNLEQGYERESNSKRQHRENDKRMDELNQGQGERKATDPKEPLNKEREAGSRQHLHSTKSPCEASIGGTSELSKEVIPTQSKTREKKPDREEHPGPCGKGKNTLRDKFFSLFDKGKTKDHTKSAETSCAQSTEVPSSTTHSFPEAADRNFPAHSAANPVKTSVSRCYSVSNVWPSTAESGACMTHASDFPSETNLQQSRRSSIASSIASSLRSFASRSSLSALSVISKKSFTGSTLSLPAYLMK